MQAEDIELTDSDFDAPMPRVLSPEELYALEIESERSLRDRRQAQREAGDPRESQARKKAATAKENVEFHLDPEAPDFWFQLFSLRAVTAQQDYASEIQSQRQIEERRREAAERQRSIDEWDQQVATTQRTLTSMGLHPPLTHPREGKVEVWRTGGRVQFAARWERRPFSGNLGLIPIPQEPWEANDTYALRVLRLVADNAAQYITPRTRGRGRGGARGGRGRGSQHT